MRSIILKLILIFILFYCSGCVTVITDKRLSVSTLQEKSELAKSLSAEKTYELLRRLRAYLNTEEDMRVLREEMVARHPEWTSEMKAFVEAGQIKIGMLEEQLLSSWGNPDKVNKNVGEWGVFEQWSYGDVRYPYNVTYYIYVENGILTSWQKNE
ncbi:MAG: hypothetical protein PHY56_05000 [Candidatus Omnitrophica bacterium]|nr:hypothetical protein [Candidatus Omnitrophota bacterium]